MSVGNVFNIEPEPVSCPGDYLYRSGSLRWDVESGMGHFPNRKPQRPLLLRNCVSKFPAVVGEKMV